MPLAKLRLATASTVQEIRDIPESQGRLIEVILPFTGTRYIYAAGNRHPDDGVNVLKPSFLSDEEDGRWIAELIVGTLNHPLAISDVVSLQPALDTLQSEIDSLVGGGGSGESFTAENKDSVTIKAGQPVAIHSSGTGVVRANAGVSGKDMAGLATVDIAPTFSGIVQVDGPMTLADWTDATGAATLGARATYFLDTTAGKLTTTPPSVPGNYAQIGGKELSSNTLEIRIREPLLL